MSRLHGAANLANDFRHFFGRQRSTAIGVLLKNFSAGPFDGQEVSLAVGLPELYGANDVRMFGACAKLRFTQKARDSGFVVPQLIAQHLEGNGSVLGVFGAKNCRSTTFSDFGAHRVTSKRSPDQRLSGHGANVTQWEAGVQAHSCASFASP